MCRGYQPLDGTILGQVLYSKLVTRHVLGVLQMIHATNAHRGNQPPNTSPSIGSSPPRSKCNMICYQICILSSLKYFLAKFSNVSMQIECGFLCHLKVPKQGWQYRLFILYKCYNSIGHLVLIFISWIYSFSYDSIFFLLHVSLVMDLALIISDLQTSSIN